MTPGQEGDAGQPSDQASIAELGAHLQGLAQDVPEILAEGSASLEGAKDTLAGAAGGGGGNTHLAEIMSRLDEATAKLNSAAGALAIFKSSIDEYLAAIGYGGEPEPPSPMGYAELQFRDECLPMPIVADREHLGALIRTRLRPGLQKLLRENADLEDIDYAGFTLHAYAHPQQRLDFKNPEAAQAILNALLGADVPMISGPVQNAQDFYLRRGDCFDIRALARADPERWNEGFRRQRSIRETDFILGPVIRLHCDDYPGSDDYNQDKTLRFITRHSIVLPGRLLLDILHEYDPSLLDGSNLPDGVLSKALTDEFDLRPANNSFQEEWIRGRNA